MKNSNVSWAASSTTIASATTASIIALAASLFACASASQADASRASNAPVTRASVDANAGLMGTWSFVLDASDVASRVREHCAKESGGDDRRASACWHEATTDASNEKIRFAKDGAGRIVWTSFAVEDGKEVVFVAAPVELTADGETSVRIAITGEASGARAEEFAEAKIDRLVVERVDERTIAVLDPAKGRLVYSKE